IRIPERIDLVPTHFRYVEKPGLDHLAVETEIAPPRHGDLRIILQQRDPDGSVVRSNSGGPMGKFFVIRASQGGKQLPVEIRYDTTIWSGLSWGVGEVRRDEWVPGQPIRIELASAEHDPEIHLDGRVYRVEY
ncbi:MAG TPA: hypothetical protein VKU84_01165, partial [Stellaceae bacterium]|nr:hypothetical protein [Stellaceae bacterium]